MFCGGRTKLLGSISELASFKYLSKTILFIV
jgi:hypothetical protein